MLRSLKILLILIYKIKVRGPIVIRYRFPINLDSDLSRYFVFR